MKKTPAMIIKETDESRELFLYGYNTSRFWPRIMAIKDMLQKHINKDRYNHDKAIEAYYPAMHDIAKAYLKEFCNDENPKVFDVTAKWTAAEEVLRNIEEQYLEFKEGEKQ